MDYAELAKLKEMADKLQESNGSNVEPSLLQTVVLMANLMEDMAYAADELRGELADVEIDVRDLDHRVSDIEDSNE